MATINISISLKEEEQEIWKKLREIYPIDTQDKKIVLDALNLLVKAKKIKDVS